MGRVLRENYTSTEIEIMQCIKSKAFNVLLHITSLALTSRCLLIKQQLFGIEWQEQYFVPLYRLQTTEIPTLTVSARWDCFSSSVNMWS
jgi:hypothetical protein